MEVKSRCPNPECRKSYRVPLTALGRGTTCKKCGKKFVLKEEKDQQDDTSERPKQQATVKVPAVRLQAPAIKEKPPAIPLRESPQIEFAVPPSSPSPSIQTVVAVSVTNQHRGSSLGMASVVLGILAFLICWIPLVNVISMLFAGIGFFLAMIGLIVALFRKGAGVGMPIAGATVCAIAMIVSVLITGSLVAGAKAVGDQIVADVKRQNATNQVVVQTPQQPVPSAPVKSMPEATAKTPAVSPAPNIQPEPATEDPKASEEEAWASAESPVRQGDIEARIIAVNVGKVSLKEQIGGDEGSSKDVLLSIEIEIKNLSETKKLNYRSWGADTPVFDRASPILTDNFDNQYKGVKFGIATKVVGSVSSESVYPGKSISDVIVFEEPIGKVEHLNLELPASNFGGAGMLRLRIPVSMIKSKGE